MSATQLTQFVENEGILIPIELWDLPFVPARVFYVTDVPAGDIRGKHAHYKTEQILICVQGKIDVTLRSKNQAGSTLLTPGQCIYVGKMVWDEQRYVTGNDILLSICSTPYDPDDYILDYEQFTRLITND